MIILNICIFIQTKYKPALISNLFPDHMIQESIWISVCYISGNSHISPHLFKTTFRGPFLKKLTMSARGRKYCSRELDRNQQSRNNGPSMECHQSGKAWVPSNWQNWKNKDLTPRLTFPPLAYRSLCGLDPQRLRPFILSVLQFGPSLTFPPLVCH